MYFFKQGPGHGYKVLSITVGLFTLILLSPLNAYPQNQEISPFATELEEIADSFQNFTLPQAVETPSPDANLDEIRTADSSIQKLPTEQPPPPAVNNPPTTPAESPFTADDWALLEKLEHKQVKRKKSSKN